MSEQNSKSEKPKDERRYDPELFKKGLRCDLNQYDFLKQCSENGEEGIKRWNEWRSEKQNRHKDIHLEGVSLAECYLKNIDLGLKGVYIGEGSDKKAPSKVFLREAHLKWAKLQGASLRFTHLEGAKMEFAHLEDADISNAHLEGANLLETNLRGANLTEAKLQGADFSRAIVDGDTLIWTYEIDQETKFEGVGLDAARIYPRTKQLLECVIRRMNWEELYKYKDWYELKPNRERSSYRQFLLRNTIGRFWKISGYGISTKRIIYTFFGLAFVFALLYRLFPDFVKVYGNVGDIRGLWHALYFSVVTMTTLGFGDIAANPDSWLGQTLLMAQVILGYVLLGALVTRFAVLFAAGGPAGKFAKRTWDRSCPKPKTGWDELEQNKTILQTGDVIHVQNRGILSKLIRFFSRAWKEEPSWASHSAMVLRVGDEIEIIEAIWKTVIRPITAYKGKKSMLLVSRKPGGIDQEQQQKMIEKAEYYNGKTYGFWKIVFHALDRLLNNRYIFRRLIKDNEYPICSWLVAYVYDRILGYQFGTEPNAAQPDDILDHCLDYDWEFIWADSSKSVADFCRTYKLLDNNDVA